MRLTKDSEQLIKCILDNNFFYLSKKENAKMIKIKKIIYEDIKSSYNYTNKYILFNPLKPIVKNEKPNIMVYSKFVPQLIKEDIKSHYKWKLIYNINIDNKNLKIIFGIKSETFPKNIFDNKVKHIIALVKYFLLYTKNDKIKNISLYLYLTPYKKYIPSNPIDVLSPTHCNSALTYPCEKNVSIFLFRDEEWFKVLAHEIMHAFCLDFSVFKTNMVQNELYKIFPIKSDFLLSETYAEYWATFTNCAFISYNQYLDTNDFKDFKIYFNILYNFEKYFAFIQCVKILNHMNLKYKNLFDNTIKKEIKGMMYKENTNVFVYYILKLIFYYFDNDFLSICFDNNDNIIHFDKTELNLKRILKFIKKKHDNPQLLSKIKLFETMVDNFNMSKHDFVLKTNRMTINDILL